IGIRAARGGRRAGGLGNRFAERGARSSGGRPLGAGGSGRSLVGEGPAVASASDRFGSKRSLARPLAILMLTSFHRRFHSSAVFGVALSLTACIVPIHLASGQSDSQSDSGATICVLGGVIYPAGSKNPADFSEACDPMSDAGWVLRFTPRV